MKAKQYAEMFNKNPTKESLVEIATLFDKETSELIEKRNVKTDSSFLSVLREMDDKWKAFAKLTAGAVKSDGYRIIMRQLHPSTAEFAWPTTSV